MRTRSILPALLLLLLLFTLLQAVHVTHNAYVTCLEYGHLSGCWIVNPDDQVGAIDADEPVSFRVL